jgi:hypothetical protein
MLSSPLRSSQLPIYSLGELTPHSLPSACLVWYTLQSPAVVISLPEGQLSQVGLLKDYEVFLIVHLIHGKLISWK